MSTKFTDDGIVDFVTTYVYIVRCADGRLYVEQAGNLRSRLLKHNQGSAAAFTARRLPVSLVYCEVLETAAGASTGAPAQRLDACEEGGADRRRPRNPQKAVVV